MIVNQTGLRFRSTGKRLPNPYGVLSGLGDEPFGVTSGKPSPFGVTPGKPKPFGVTTLPSRTPVGASILAVATAAKQIAAKAPETTRIPNTWEAIAMQVKKPTELTPSGPPGAATAAAAWKPDLYDAVKRLQEERQAAPPPPAPPPVIVAPPPVSMPVNYGGGGPAGGYGGGAVAPAEAQEQGPPVGFWEGLSTPMKALVVGGGLFVAFLAYKMVGGGAAGGAPKSG